MKVTFEYDTSRDDTLEDIEHAGKAHSYFYALSDVRERLRCNYKYEPDGAKPPTWYEVYELFLDMVNDRGIEL